MQGSARLPSPGGCGPLDAILACQRAAPPLVMHHCENNMKLEFLAAAPELGVPTTAPVACQKSHGNDTPSPGSHQPSADTWLRVALAPLLANFEKLFADTFAAFKCWST